MPLNQSGKVNIFIIIGIVVVQLVLSYFLMTQILFKDQLAGQDDENAAMNDSLDASLADVDPDAINTDEKYAENYTIYSFNDVVINAKDGGNHFLIVTIDLEHKTEDKKLPEELALKNSILKDEIISILSSIELEKLYFKETRSIIKQKIKETVNQNLDKGKITRVFFSQYLIQ